MLQIDFVTAENEPQEAPSTQLFFFLPSRAEPSTRLAEPAAGLCAALVGTQPWQTVSVRPDVPNQKI